MSTRNCGESNWRRRSCSDVGVGDWVMGELIGQGGFGCVYQAIPIKRFKGIPGVLAVKVAHVDEPNKVSSLMTEAQILSELQDSRFVIKYYADEFRYDSHNNPVSFNLLQEYAAGGTVGDRIDDLGGCRGLPESEVRGFTASILKGLQCIHNRGYVHCDIKPDNILLVPEFGAGCDEVGFVPKIADFGLAKRAENVHTRQGTRYFWPPETAVGGVQGKAADVWALGCVVLEMLTGMLWPSTASDDLTSWVSNPVIPAHLSPEARDFLAKCLHIDASKRFTVDMLLAHSFVSEPTTDQTNADFSKSSQSDQTVDLSKSQSEYCHTGLPSYISLGASSSVESFKSEEGSSFEKIFSMAIMSNRARPVIAVDTWCTKPTFFPLMEALSISKELKPVGKRVVPDS